MTTYLDAITDDSLINRLNVGELKTRINNRRGQNNPDFLDDTKLLHYINDAIDELNMRDDFRGSLRSTTYAINTSTTRFYAFSTIFGSYGIERLDYITRNTDTARRSILKYGEDYVFEYDDSAQKRGIHFNTNINDTMFFSYYAYIPKITLDSEYINIDHTANKYFIYKVQQYVYESQHTYDKADRAERKAEEAVRELIANNSDEYDDHMLVNPSFNY